jgi:hypothetical protein
MKDSRATSRGECRVPVSALERAPLARSQRTATPKLESTYAGPAHILDLFTEDGLTFAECSARSGSCQQEIVGPLNQYRKAVSR